MMRVWTVANQKGGVGKTTTVVSLGGLLAERGFRTLLVDLDPHGSLTSYFKYDPDTLESSVYSLFQAAASQASPDPSRLLCKTEVPYLTLLPGVMALATLDRLANKVEGMGLVLKKALLRLKNDLDFVLVDCPPVLGVLMINALAACERLIIPVQTEFLALKGLERMLHTLDMVLKARRDPLPCTILPTLYDARTRGAVDTLALLREQYPDRLSSWVIPLDNRLREASRAGLPPGMFAPKARGMDAYRQLLEELLTPGGSMGPSGIT